MEHSVKLNETIDRLTIPYKNIFTTVYLVRCGRENILFDAASYDSDIDEYVLPWLKELRVTELRYVFISHNHTDHAGGLGRLMAAFPDAVIVSWHSDDGLPRGHSDSPRDAAGRTMKGSLFWINH